MLCKVASVCRRERVRFYAVPHVSSQMPVSVDLITGLLLSSIDLCASSSLLPHPPALSLSAPGMAAWPGGVAPVHPLLMLNSSIKNVVLLLGWGSCFSFCYRSGVVMIV